MKMRRHITKAHREYFLTLVRAKGGERVQWYLPYVYRTEAEAQRVADERNRHYTHGRLIVEYVDRPQSVGFSSTLKLGKL